MHRPALVITPERAQEIVEHGKDRAEGIVIGLDKLREILRTNIGGHTIVECLPGIALRAYSLPGEPPENVTVTFSRKALENIIDGRQPDDDMNPPHLY